MLSLALLCALAASPARVRDTRPEDLAAIRQVMTDFQTAIRTHDGKLLFSLMHDWHILFASPPTPELVEQTRAIDPNYAGLRPGGLQRFVEFIAGSKDKLEERFLNPTIVQDGDLAVVTFDFLFLENGEVTNAGLEVWQLTKRAGQWKLVSVMWTNHDVPKR